MRNSRESVNLSGEPTTHTTMNHIEYLKSLNACSDGLAWASDNTTSLEHLWDVCQRSDWMLWLDREANLLDDRTRRLLACAFVRRTPLGDGRTVWDLLTDERSRNAVEVAERYANGEATDEELSAAWSAAWAAAAWVADAAWAAASVAQADIIREIAGNPFRKP